jgi:hypothetical protein
MRTAIALLVAFVAMLVGCGGGSGGGSEAASPPVASGDAPAPRQAREKAPEIRGEALDGSSVTLSDFRGRAVLVNVWSSW